MNDRKRQKCRAARLMQPRIRGIQKFAQNIRELMVHFTDSMTRIAAALSEWISGIDIHEMLALIEEARKSSDD